MSRTPAPIPAPASCSGRTTGRNWEERERRSEFSRQALRGGGGTAGSPAHNSIIHGPSWLPMSSSKPPSAMTATSENAPGRPQQLEGFCLGKREEPRGFGCCTNRGTGLRAAAKAAAPQRTPRNEHPCPPPACPTVTRGKDLGFAASGSELCALAIGSALECRSCRNRGMCCLQAAWLPDHGWRLLVVRSCSLRPVSRILHYNLGRCTHTAKPPRSM